MMRPFKELQITVSRRVALKVWGEWLSGLNCCRQVTEARSSEVKLRMGDLGGLTSQLTLSSFGRDVKLGVPCLDAPCTVGLN